MVIIVRSGAYTLRCRARLTSNVRHREYQHAPAASQGNRRTANASAGHRGAQDQYRFVEEAADSRSQDKRHASAQLGRSRLRRKRGKRRNGQTPNRKLHHRAPRPRWARPCGCLARCAKQPSLLHRLLRSPCPRRPPVLRQAGTACEWYCGGLVASPATAGEFHKGPAKRSLRQGGA